MTDSLCQVASTLLIRFLQSSSIGDSDNSSDNIMNLTTTTAPSMAPVAAPGSASEGSQRDAYEFVAFILWYTFLVLCCVIPTCCAYRRRLINEARFTQEQRASFEQLQRLQHEAQNNVFILSNLHELRAAGGGGIGSSGLLNMDGEAAQTERTRRIREALAETTFDVKAGDILETVDEGAVPVTIVTVDGEQDEREQAKGGSADEELGNTAEGGVVSEVMDYIGPDGLNMDHCLLQLPQSASAAVGDEESQLSSSTSTPSSASPQSMPPNANRTVPGGCAICLSAYEAGDSVTWSQKEGCIHAFHTDCIVPWLAKKNEPKCACCRRDFCTYERLTPMDLVTLTPFGLISSSMLASSMFQQPISGRYVFPVVPPPNLGEPMSTNTTMNSEIITATRQQQEQHSQQQGSEQVILTVNNQGETMTTATHQDEIVPSPDLVASHQLMEQQLHIQHQLWRYGS